MRWRVTGTLIPRNSLVQFWPIFQLEEKKNLRRPRDATSQRNQSF